MASGSKRLVCSRLPGGISIGLGGVGSSIFVPVRGPDGWPVPSGLPVIPGIGVGALGVRLQPTMPSEKASTTNKRYKILVCFMVILTGLCHLAQLGWEQLPGVC